MCVCAHVCVVFNADFFFFKAWQRLRTALTRYGKRSSIYTSQIHLMMILAI